MLDLQRSREEREEYSFSSFSLFSSSILSAVPLRIASASAWEKTQIFLLIEQSFEVSPLSLFAFPTPALVALSLHPPPRKLELESKSQLNECQSGLCWSSLQKPICLMSGFNTFVCCRRANQLVFGNIVTAQMLSVFQNYFSKYKYQAGQYVAVGIFVNLTIFETSAFTKFDK